MGVDILAVEAEDLIQRVAVDDGAQPYHWMLRIEQVPEVADRPVYISIVHLVQQIVLRSPALQGILRLAHLGEKIPADLLVGDLGK